MYFHLNLSLYDLCLTAIYHRPLCGTKICAISNKVGNISGLKKFVISSFPAPRSPVVLSAIYQAFDNSKNGMISRAYLLQFDNYRIVEYGKKSFADDLSN
jgi:hypothetical protein